MVQQSLTVLPTATFQFIFIRSRGTFHFKHHRPVCVCVCICLCVRHMVGHCCYDNVAGMKTEVAGWGQAQWGAGLRLTVTVTLERGE